MKKLLITLLLFLTLPDVSYCQQDGYIREEAGVIHYKKYGAGIPVLIINGGPGLDCEGFTSFAELLSDQYMTILYDQRGTGQSILKVSDTSTVTMELMAKDIEKIRTALKIDQWIVAGHSFGGWLAEYYATKYPASIKAMILSSSAGIDMELLKYFDANMQMGLSKTERDSLAYWNQKINSGDTSYFARYQKGKYMAPAYLFKKEFVPQLAKRLAKGGAPEITRLVYKDLFKIRLNFQESLRSFSKPVLIIQGRQDIVGAGAAFRAHAVLKNSQLVFINECNHYGWLEQKDQFKAAIENFIASCK